VEDPTDNPDYKNAAYNSMAPAWQIWSDVTGGTAKMRAAGATYLPQEKGESPENFNARKARAVFFNASVRTRDALVGMVFKDNPKLEDDVPLDIKADFENVDLAGTHFDVFAKELFVDAFDGHAFILVDMQPALGEGSTLEDERASGHRPYWVRYTASQAFNWRTEVINGETILAQITFEENTNEPKGKYGEESVCRYRTFQLNNGVVTWELSRKTVNAATKEATFQIVDQGEVKGLNRIPVVVIYGNQTGGRWALQSTPPLQDLAYLNIAHYQELSDYREQLHALVPILVRVGVPEEQRLTLTVGPHSLTDLPNKDCDLKYVSHDGQALEATRGGLIDTEQRMAMSGVSMLAQKTDTQKTATEINANNLQESSDLSTMARSLSDGLEEAAGIHAKYKGKESGGSITLSVAETGAPPDASMVLALIAAVNARLLTNDTFLTMLQKAFPGVDLQDELKKLQAMPGFGQAPPTVQDIQKMKGGVAKILTPAPGPAGVQ
jgi:hypothetical protein